MASYKVPQDVEAEDKLIGPFSFRQFIYLVVVAIAIALAWFLSQIFIGLVLIPMPIIIFFGALALPLRKDQPMEIYLAALVRFYLKPKLRMWQPEGQFNHVTITAPTVEEKQRTKDFTADEAGQRLSYLAQVIDTGGWSTRNAAPPSSLNPAIAAEAAGTEDVFDDGGELGMGFSSLIEEQEELRRAQAKARFQEGFHNPESVVAPPATTPPIGQYSVPQAASEPSVGVPTFNPYPTMHQHVISPQGQTPSPQPVQATPIAPAPAPLPPTQTISDNTSTNQPSPDIMRLANNNDLSISAIAREAHRIEDTQNNQEVVITLR